MARNAERLDAAAWPSTALTGSRLARTGGNVIVLYALRMMSATNMSGLSQSMTSSAAARLLQAPALGDVGAEAVKNGGVGPFALGACGSDQRGYGPVVLCCGRRAGQANHGRVWRRERRKCSLNVRCARRYTLCLSSASNMM